MTIEFSDRDLERLYLTGQRAGRYRRLDRIVVKKFVMAIDKMRTMDAVTDFWKYPSLRFEKLNNDYCSVRLNDQYRLLFTLSMADAVLIENCEIDEISKHYE